MTAAPKGGAGPPFEFAHRGVVEGYYGEAWSHVDRLWLLDRLGSWGMNRYLYAPKDDPLQRARWREAYSADQMQAFGELIERGQRAGPSPVDVGFALSPGACIRYSSAQDVETLVRKFGAFAERGARFFALALDDISSELGHESDRRAFASLAAAHIHLSHALRDALGPDCLIWLVPTDYAGVGSSDYLQELGDRLDPAIEVGWTGRSVLPATIRSSEAALRSRALRRRLLVWDNTPVTDGPMRNMLHLGPYTGRDPELAQHCSGMLLNPMQHPRASAVTLRTAADYLADPEHYEQEESWREALREAGAGAPGAFAHFASAHRFSFMAPNDRDAELSVAIDKLQSHLPTALDPDDPNDPSERASECARALAALDLLLEQRESAASQLRADLSDRALAAELEPWLASHSRECQRMRVALDCLEVLCGDPSQNAKGLAMARMEGRLTRLPVPSATSFGPRRVLYPAFESLTEDATRFGPEAGLFLDRCLTDHLIRLAERSASEQLGLVCHRSPDETQ